MSTKEARRFESARLAAREAALRINNTYQAADAAELAWIRAERAKVSDSDPSPWAHLVRGHAIFCEREYAT